jgi:hypothetical protein
MRIMFTVLARWLALLSLLAVVGAAKLQSRGGAQDVSMAGVVSHPYYCVPGLIDSPCSCPAFGGHQDILSGWVRNS